MSPETTIDRYCEAWSVDDPGQRSALLATVWADGAVYCDPTVSAVGAPALLDHIAAVLARRPGARVLRTSALDHHHDVARFTWAAVAADGAILRDGIDVAIFDPSGRIARMIGFFGPPSARPRTDEIAAQHARR